MEGSDRHGGAKLSDRLRVWVFEPWLDRFGVGSASTWASLPGELFEQSKAGGVRLSDYVHSSSSDLLGMQVYG